MIGVAMDVQGADAARPYYEKAKVTYTALVDESNLLGQLYGFRAVPNVLILDELGILRHKGNGHETEGFIEKLLGEPVDTTQLAKQPKRGAANTIEAREARLKESPDDAQLLIELGDAYKAARRYKDAAEQYRKAVRVQPTSADGYFRLGCVLFRLGKKGESVVDLKKALKLDPNNWIIHKQIWAIEHPDKFYKGSVDYGWQRAQLKLEREGK